MKAQILAAGSAEGVPVLIEPLSFWGGFDAATGSVMDRWHPAHGKSLAGTVLMMEQGRGSSSGASVLAEAIRLGTAPAAILLRRRDAILVTGALVARQLYEKAMPILVVDEVDWQACAAATALQIDEDGQITART